ncbi:MAG TPA: EAL domain-containing protein [Pyrinomonadaceae bacterium]|nr:EAL domain-containing protein [Pyrinomonadaceae bacterium]
MENKEKNNNVYASILLPVGFTVLVWSIYSFPLAQIGTGLIALAVVTVFFSSYLGIQLPRTKIHLTISDALILLSLLIYGGETAVLLAGFESFYTSLRFRSKGINIKTKTIFINIAIASVSTFLTAQVVHSVFGSTQTIIESGGATIFISLLTIMGLTQFIANSICVAGFAALKSGKSVWKVWNEYCLNALVMFLTGAAMAGVLAKAIEQINMFLFAVIIGFFAVAYMTYRRYVDDVKETAEKAEQAERERAEQAERHIVELQHHIAEQDRIGQALRESKERFRHAAFHDALTDLPNRNQFIETLKFLLEKSRQTPDFNFAVLFLDLNRFKTINESLGHSTGDNLLKNVGERLKKLIGEDDMLARFGGDEFGIILSHVRTVEDTVSFAQLIDYKLSSPFAIGGRQVFVNASIGIALGSASYQEAEDVLRDADIAMYYAKDHEKNYEIFDQTMHTRAVTLLQIETDLRYAVERGELLAFYQPIINLETMQLGGFETLIRWNHPQRGLVSPGDFIPVSEETGLIVPITLWILRESCRQMVEWQNLDEANKSLILSVNLSGKHFSQGSIVEEVQKIIVETGIEPSRLKLEITESAVMENAEMVIAMLKQLKELGVQLSIDDFGTGYSSLSYLHRFPIDTLKVDRSFVSTMEDGSENGEIVRTIIALAKALGMDVVAEGIETIHQLHQLRILGCEYGQGFLFSRPVPCGEAEKIVVDKTRWQTILPTPKLVIPPPQEVPHLRLAK